MVDGSLVLSEKHERAVYHTYVLHTVALDSQVKILVSVLNVGVLVAEDALVGDYGRACAYLADYRYPR